MSYRTLVIEDEVADIVRKKLEREGHAVTIAPDQRVAYHLLDEQRFDFVILDLRLPTYEGAMDEDPEVGFDILDHIRDRFSQDQLPVVVMTAYEETSQTAIRALKAGADDYITKPFEDSCESLEEKLKQIVRGIHEVRPQVGVSGSPIAQKAHRVVFKRNAHVEVDGIAIGGRPADLIRLLGKRTMTCWLGDARDDKPLMKASEIAEVLDMTEDGVRKALNRLRDRIAEEYERRSLGQIDRQDIVKNTPWKGYELNHETCEFSYE